MKRGESLSWATSIIERRYPKLNPRPDYQREAVWTIPQKQLLIDSIIRNMDIPKLYLRALPKGSQYEYEVIDGQQRLNSVWSFRRNEYPLSKEFTPEYAGLLYKQLPEEIKDQVDLYQLDFTVIDEATDQEIRDMFCRLQNGTPLNAAEKRNAIVSNMRDFIDNLVTTHPVFKYYQKGNKRYGHDQVAAQVTLLELTGGPANVRNTQLEHMYKTEKGFDADGPEARRIKKVLNYLARAFKEDTPEFNTRAQFVSLYLLVSQMIDRYSMSGREEQLRDFFVRFETYRRLEKNDIEMVRYTEALSRSSDGREQIERRHQILTREWLSFAPDIEYRDPQRMFSYEQRLAIFRRDGETCKICGQPVAWDDFDADHIIPHSQGGKTTVANGQTTHKVCNQGKGARY